MAAVTRGDRPKADTAIASATVSLHHRVKRLRILPLRSCGEEDKSTADADRDAAADAVALIHAAVCTPIEDARIGGVVAALVLNELLAAGGDEIEGDAVVGAVKKVGTACAPPVAVAVEGGGAEGVLLAEASVAGVGAGGEIVGSDWTAGGGAEGVP